MHPYPHLYQVSAQGRASGAVTVHAPGLPELSTSAPPQFGGPEGQWSPETLLCAAVADCFILTFRAVSRAARFEWHSLDCQVDGTLDKVDGSAQFTRMVTRVELVVAPQADEAQARALLDKAEHGCLIANSLKAARSLDVRIARAIQSD